MYLVMTIQNNRVKSVKAFTDWHKATLHADTVAISLKRGLSAEMLAWENSDYQNAFEYKGTAVMIEPCDNPQD